MRHGKHCCLADTTEGRPLDLFKTIKPHPLRVIKQQFGFQKTYLRSRAKTAKRLSC